MKRLVAVIALSLALFGGGLAAPASAHSGHYCGTGAHYWTVSGRQYRELYSGFTVSGRYYYYRYKLQYRNVQTGKYITTGSRVRLCGVVT